jgi:hypothetical protein
MIVAVPIVGLQIFIGPAVAVVIDAVERFFVNAAIAVIVKPQAKSPK